MKKTVILLLMCILAVFMAAQAAAAMLLEYDDGVHEYSGSVYKLYVNGKSIETPLEPIIFNDRALVPVREVFEAAGAKVNYNGETKGIYIEGNGIRLNMKIGSDKLSVNGEEKTFLDGVAPKLISKKGESAKTMVPVRFISETLGYEVNFTGSAIEINTEKQAVVLSDVYCKRSGDAVMISIKSNAEMKSVSKAEKTSSGVVYVDIKNSESKLPGSINVNKAAVKKIRVGVHDDYVRIALDTENLKSFSSKLSADKKTLMITTVKKAEQTAEKEKIVVIDAGHGGSDGGAGRDFDGEYKKEKDINLAVALKTVDILRSNGVKVEMTRTGDTYPTLTERSDYANSLDAAVFVSIHSNSASSESPNGIEVYYSEQNNSADYGTTSKELAGKILSALIAQTGAKNRKVKAENHVVTRTSQMPACLVEIGFITNDAEMRNLLNPDYQYKLASGVAEGIIKCLPKITVPSGDNANFTENDLGDKIS